MSNDGSVAPKERVNISYRSAIGEVQKEIELPLKLMIMGDFTMKEDSRTLEERKPVTIGQYNFSDVMEGLDLDLDLIVPDRLSGKDDEDMDIHLSFKNMRDFEPDSIVEQVPELKKIIQLRKALLALKGPLGNVPNVRKTIQKIIDDETSRNKLMAELSLT